MKNRRKFFRLREDDKILYSEIPHAKSERMLSLDISEGGLRFLSDHFINPGALLKIEMSFERAKKVVDVVATVKWIKTLYEDERYEVGAQFLDIAEADLAFLRRYASQK